MLPLDTGPTNVPATSDAPSIGLCLSGGGLRAALYALGVVRYLAEAGHLPRVQAVSAVSGGSIAAAVLADRWPALASAGYTVEAFEREVEAPFVSAITSRNLRNRSLGRWAGRRLTLRGPARGSVLGDVLVEELLSARRVVELDAALQVILTSTDLATGRAFRVSREFIGSYDFGYRAPAEHLSLGEAIAASAAVPVLFPPVYLPTAGLGLRDAPEVLSLVDGGVYDNLGMEWFQGWASGRPPAARDVAFLIVVDASGPLRREPKRYRGVAALRRTRDIQYFQTRASRIRWYVEDLLAGKRDGLYLVSKSDPARFRLPNGTPINPELYAGALRAGFAEPLAALRTDLDRFTEEEADLLRYHGYWSAHARLGSIRPDLAVAGEPHWRQYASVSEEDSRRLFALIGKGAKRRIRH
jgi:NTE family protein